MAKKAKKAKEEEAPKAAIVGASKMPGFLTGMEKAILAAASQLIGQFDLSDELPAGDYPIDGEIVLRLGGVAKKMKPEEYVPTVAIPHKLVLEILLGKMGAVGPAVEAQVFKAIEDAMEEAAKGSIDKERLKELSVPREEIEARVRARLDRMEKRTRVGKFISGKTGSILEVKVKPARVEEESEGAGAGAEAVEVSR